MAGGTFDKLVGKERGGTYVNFQSDKNDVLGISSRGTVIIPLCNHVWGPTGEYITINNSSPDAEQAKLGYSIYDNDENRQMLLIREAIKKAAKVLVYRVNGGTAAKATNAPITATAKYPGTRGNELSFTVSENPVGGFDVQVNLGGNKVAQYEGLMTVEELISQDCAYITFSGTGDLSAVAGVNLTGGTDTEKQNTDVTKFLDSIEGVSFNTLCFPITDDSLHAAAKTKIKYLRENMGRGVQVVMPDTKSGDYEGVINVTNSVVVDGVALTHAETCAWVAAATAAASNVQSNMGVAYEGATAIVDAKNHEEAVDALKRGEFFFSVGEGDTVVVESDINSLVTFTKPKDKSYRKNRVIRVFDSFNEALQVNFPPNKYDNDPDGWEIMEGIGRTLLKKFGPRPDGVGAIKNIDYETDFLVDRSLSEGDETYFNVSIQAVDSSEKLFFTVKTR